MNIKNPPINLLCFKESLMTMFYYISVEKNLYLSFFLINRIALRLSCRIVMQELETDTSSEMLVMLNYCFPVSSSHKQVEMISHAH